MMQNWDVWHIYIYIQYIYNPKKHPDFTWLHLFWMGNGPMAKAICGKLRSPSEVPEVPPSACQEQLQPLRFWFVLGLAEARAHQKPRKSSRPVLQWTVSRKFMTIPSSFTAFLCPSLPIVHIYIIHWSPAKIWLGCLNDGELEEATTTRLDQQHCWEDGEEHSQRIFCCDLQLGTKWFGRKFRTSFSRFESLPVGV